MKKVSSEAVKRIFEVKKAGRPCESCGQNDWVILSNFATLILQDSEVNGLSSYPVVAIECRNCGNVKFYSRERLGEVEE